MTPSPVVCDPNVAARRGPEHSPPAVHHARRRPLGAHPVPLLGGLGGLALLLAIILFALGSLVGGLVLLALAIALLTLFAGGVRRDPDAPAAGLTLRAAARARSQRELVAVRGRTWASAGIELLRIRRRQHQLRAELKGSLTPLGEAIHRDEHERAQALKQEAAELEHKLEETERQAAAAIAAARHEIEERRRAIEPTQALSPAHAAEQARNTFGGEAADDGRL